jgi:hypothetical protein
MYTPYGDYSSPAGIAAGVLILFAIIIIAMTVLNIMLACRISKAGGSGLVFFFLGWIYLTGYMLYAAVRKIFGRNGRI